MDIQALWIVVIALSAPIGAVVAFAIQLRQLRSFELQNKRLELEIADLRKRAEEAERLIVRATPSEIAEYGSKLADVQFSRGGPWRGPCPGPNDDSGPLGTTSLRDALLGGLLIGGVLAFVAYLIYDAFRVVRWIVDVAQRVF